MSVSATVLRELHRIHTQLGDLNERLSRGPRQVQARQSNVTLQETALSTAQDKVLQTKKAIDQKQLDLKSSENKILDWKVKLNTASSNREYQTFTEQIAAAEMANSVMADEILEAMEKADQLSLEVKEVEKALAAVKNDLATFRDSVTAEGELIKGDISRLEAELAEVEKKLPATLKDEYQRVIRGKGADGMSPVEDMVCQGCGKTITLNMQNDLLLSKPIFCINCGCLLYLTE
ncbi:zinc ribbon domain-containing protein [Bythopirellula polymerisocia]|uniref:Putative zinc ribbon domain protein n=1 Tax=Bythopirellula polymerisocia TaxID=2528003 RepID=A0A5C6CQY8_9BACT|nr:phospholipase [Bythopirellula polymerisocia]TWU25974.1 putative zinc ribbon domain protein [Bythopirellula polymerisocia]